MQDGPMSPPRILQNVLPEPVRDVFRKVIPLKVRLKAYEKLFPHHQNVARAVGFWANPTERRRRMAELRNCKTLHDYFAFATAYMGHQQWSHEILGFLNFAKEQKPVRICELGMFQGGNNIMLTHALPTVEQIIGVDLYIRNKSQLKYYAKPNQRQTFVEGSTRSKATMKKVTQALGGEKLDLLFIDADHSYEGAKQDFMLYRHLVRDGGIIAFHDIVQDHMTKFGHDPATWGGAQSGEVYLLWKRLKPYYENTKEFVVDYEQDGCGIGALLYS
jgi:cephalosporin hydroxylase